MKLLIVGDVKCSSCGSEDVRSSVTTEEGCQFKCDSCGDRFFVANADLNILGTAELPDVPADSFELLGGPGAPILRTKMMPGQEPYSVEETAQLNLLVSDAAAGDPGEAAEPVCPRCGATNIPESHVCADLDKSGHGDLRWSKEEQA